MGYEPEFRSRGEYQPQDLIAGDFPLKTESIVLEKGQNLPRGAVLGQKTNTGKFVLSAISAADNTPIADGSEQPRRILADDVDATEKDKPAIAYLTGAFYGPGLMLGKGHTLDSVIADFETRSIFVQG